MLGKERETRREGRWKEWGLERGRVEGKGDCWKEIAKEDAESVFVKRKTNKAYSRGAGRGAGLREWEGGRRGRAAESKAGQT